MLLVLENVLERVVTGIQKILSHVISIGYKQAGSKGAFVYGQMDDGPKVPTRNGLIGWIVVEDIKREAIVKLILNQFCAGIVDAPFCPTYSFHFNFCWVSGPFCVKVRVWEPQTCLLILYYFILFYRVS